MAGKLFDVWYVPRGRIGRREKICVTLDLPSVKTWAFEILQQRVKEQFGDGRLMSHGMWSRIEVTDRPDGNLVWSIRFDGKQKGSLRG
jgi:hypothetical protein